MAKFEVKLISGGVQSLLKSPELASACVDAAAGIKSRCGAGYSMDTYVGAHRVNCSVYAETEAAKRDNLNNNTILKAIK